MSVGLILSNPAGAAFVFFVLILGMMQATRMFEVQKERWLGISGQKGERHKRQVCSITYKENTHIS